MLGLTIVIVAALFILAFYIFDKDFFAPASAVALVFLFGLFCTFYNEEKWGLNFSGKTTLLIVTTIICFIIGGMAAVFILRLSKGGQSPLVHDVYAAEVIPISTVRTLIVIMIQVVAFFLVFKHVQQVSGSSNWLVAVTRYRELTGHLADLNDSTIKMSILTKNMLQLSFMIGLVYSYIVGNNLVASKKKISIDWIPILMYALTTFIRGDRSNMIRLWLTVLLTAYTVKKRSVGWKSSREMRKMVRNIAVSVLIVGVVFVAVRRLAGRTSTKDPFYYVTFYAGAPIAVLDQIWVNPFPKPDLFGKQTFFYTYDTIRFLTKWPAKYSFYSVFINSPNGTSIGNARTALRDPYTEFGYGGFIVYMLLMGFFYALVYCGIRKKRGKGPIDIHLLIYTYIAYTYFMYFYSMFNQFISHVFIKYIIEWVLIIWALTAGNVLRIPTQFSLKRKTRSG